MVSEAPQGRCRGRRCEKHCCKTIAALELFANLWKRSAKSSPAKQRAHDKAREAPRVQLESQRESKTAPIVEAGNSYPTLPL